MKAKHTNKKGNPNPKQNMFPLSRPFSQVPKLITDHIDSLGGRVKAAKKAEGKKGKSRHDVDFQAIRQAYCNIIAGGWCSACI